MRTILLLAATFACATACTRDSGAAAARAVADSVRADSTARARQDSINRSLPGYVIDSIFPVHEELRRFRAAHPGDSATTFAAGSSSRSELVRRFLTALSTRDTSALRTFAVQAREFSDLYYPDSPYSHPPYKESPEFAWRLIQAPSSAGLTKLLNRIAGKPLAYVSDTCDPKVLREGKTTRFAGCLVRVVIDGDTAMKRFYGSIVERGGKYKFLSYTNDF